MKRERKIIENWECIEVTGYKPGDFIIEKVDDNIRELRFFRPKRQIAGGVLSASWERLYK